jgi:transposase
MNDAREAQLLQELAARDALLTERDALLVQRETQLARAQQEIEVLKKKLDQLARKFFGKKSEQLDPQQLQMLFQELEAPGPAEGKESGPQALEAPLVRPRSAPRPRRARTLSLPEHLPVVEEIIEPPQVQARPEAWRRIGEEVSERLDYEPARFFRRRTVRPKYVSRENSELAPIVASLAPCLLERSLATPAVLALILVSKYCDHLPLYRQEAIYWRQHQVLLSRQLMALWVGLAAHWLRLIYEQLRQEVMSQGYVQIDETPIRYLEPGHGQTKLGYLWVCHQPGGDTVYFWQTSRAAECLEKIVPVDFAGRIQCDGYPGYDAFARQRGEAIELAGCWAHVRRHFYDAREEAPKAAGLILHLIQNLYRTEERLRKSKASPKLRVLARQNESRPIIARVHHILKCWEKKRRFLPQSLLGKAIAYALGEWDSLLVYLRDGRLEIDNNLVENAIRPTALGKKNWLFFGEAHAGERSAIIYTVIEACRRRRLDPFAYLRDLFTRLPTATNWQIKDLTPEAWAKAEASRTARRPAAA